MDDNKVAVLVEDMMSQFRVSGEGQQNLINTVAEIKNEIETIRLDLGDLMIENRLDHQKNNQEHQQMMQMIQELAIDQSEIKKKVTDLDQEFEIKLRRVK